MTNPTVVYLAHPLGADTRDEIKANISRAKRWILWAITNYQVAVVANWILYCEVLDDMNPAHRELGIQHDLAIMRRCDELWLVGGRVSSGMRQELIDARRHQLVVRDFTEYGPSPFAFEPPKLQDVPCVETEFLHPDDVGKEF
jgi:hypothetical protein